MTRTEALFLVSAAVGSAIAGLMLPPEPVAAQTLTAASHPTADDHNVPFSVACYCGVRSGRSGGPGPHR